MKSRKESQLTFTFRTLSLNQRHPSKQQQIQKSSADDEKKFKKYK